MRLPHSHIRLSDIEITHSQNIESALEMTACIIHASTQVSPSVTLRGGVPTWCKESPVDRGYSECCGRTNERSKKSEMVGMD